MAGRQIVPLMEMGSRAPEAGRIRLGVQTKTKSGKMRPTSIDTFRFTSPDRQSIEQLAALYGGECIPWNEPKASPKSQWQVITTTNEIPVFLVPDGLSVWYELWAGSGCQRRCDGVTVSVPEKLNEYDYELVEHPCICVHNQVRECDPHTRLQIIIPQVKFRGVWRLETKGWNATYELPGMFDLIVALGQRGQMVQALLGVERREQPTVVGKRSFVVPRLSIQQSALELQAGDAGIHAITAGSQAVATPALPSGTSNVPSEDDYFDAVDDDEIAEAEVVDDELLAIEQRLRDDATNFGLDPDRYVAALTKTTNGDRARMSLASERVRGEEIVPVGFAANGTIQWQIN